jgi:hypothetical protein
MKKIKVKQRRRTKWSAKVSEERPDRYADRLRETAVRFSEIIGAMREHYTEMYQ